MDVAVDSTVDVNQGGGGDGGDGGSNSNTGAVIGLSVTLGLLLLGLMVAAVVHKRNLIMGWVAERRQAGRKEPVKDSSSERSSVDYKARRNNQGLFNLQSVTIHTSRGGQEPEQRGRPAVGPSQPGVMREMSSELEQRLHSRNNPQPPPPPPPAKKAPAPQVPPVGPVKHSTAGIKFNERAEVVELEKDKR